MSGLWTATELMMTMLSEEAQPGDGFTEQREMCRLMEIGSFSKERREWNLKRTRGVGKMWQLLAMKGYPRL